ncbi:MAG: hypothetical protein ABWY71_01305 [Candidatus Saccharimonadales bacterium]
MGDGQSQQNPAGDLRKARGTGFPAVSLPDAVAIIQTAGNNGRKHTITAMAAYAGHTTPNSGPFRQKLAALKDWGFLTTTAATVTLTDAGMGVALPSSPEAALDIVRTAFQACQIFRTVYDEAAKGVPLYPSSIGNVAVTAHGIGVRSKETFIKSFIDSAIAVGLAGKLPNGEVKLYAGVVSADAPALENQVSAPVSPEPVPQVPAVQQPERLSAPETQTPVVNQVWKDGHIKVVLQVYSDTPLAATAFMQVGEVTTAIEVLYDIVRSGD